VIVIIPGRQVNGRFGNHLNRSNKTTANSAIRQVCFVIFFIQQRSLDPELTGSGSCRGKRVRVRVCVRRVFVSKYTLLLLHREHTKTKLNSVALVRTRTIPTERRPPPVGEVSANFCG